MRSLPLVLVLAGGAALEATTNGSAPDAPVVRYLIRTEPWAADAIEAYGAFWANANGNASALPSSQVDDSPMDRARLPAVGFPFLGKRRYEAYVNANGAIFFDPAPPCGAFFAMRVPPA